MKWVLLGAALVLSGCATQTGGWSERDRIVLEGRIDDMETAQIRQKTKIASLEKRVIQLEDMMSMLSRRTSLESREIVKIEPPENRVSAQFDYYPNRGGDYEDIVISEEKKRTYFGQPVRHTTNSEPRRTKPYDDVVTNDRLPGRDEAETAPQNALPEGHQTPMIAYQEGIDLYRQGNFAEARTRFEKFLAARPEESYIDNALYWIGECFYGEGLYHEAAGYFHRIVKEYPKANKVPDALLKVSLTYYKLGKIDSAQEMLRYLMDAFPGTEAARIGKEKYESMVTK